MSCSVPIADRVLVADGVVVAVVSVAVGAPVILRINMFRLK